MPGRKNGFLAQRCNQYAETASRRHNQNSHYSKLADDTFDWQKRRRAMHRLPTGDQSLKQPHDNMFRVSDTSRTVPMMP